MSNLRDKLISRIGSNGIILNQTINQIQNHVTDTFTENITNNISTSKSHILQYVRDVNLDNETAKIKNYKSIYDYMFFPNIGIKYKTLHVDEKQKSEHIINNHNNQIMNNDNEKKNSDDEKKKAFIENLIKQLTVSNNFERYLNKYFSLTEIRCYDKLYDVENNFNVVDTNNTNLIIAFSKKEFLDTILETYPNDESIIKQFALDFPREHIFINDEQFTSTEQFLLRLSKYNKEINISSQKRNKITTMMLAMLLCCQSSFYPSFAQLYNKTLKMWKHDETTQKIHVTDMSSYNKIEFTINKNKIACSLISQYKIIDVDNEQVLCIIKTETMFDLTYERCLIIYETV